MTALKDKWRLPDDQQGRQPVGSRRPAKPRRPGRPQPRRSRPFRQGLLLGICLGMTGALLVGVIGFLATRPRTVTPVAAPTTASAAARQNPQAAISIVSEHLGDLQVRIEAKVSAPGSYNPITKGQVVAYTDMVAMPQAHKQGPLVMAEVSGKPGVYEAMSNVPMAGEYNVIVEVKMPMAATANQRLTVGTVTR
jgi:YtkA-like protein